MTSSNTRTPLVAALLALATIGGAHAGNDVRITFTNLAPAGGLGVAPLWVGFHDGSFDAFTAGTAASIGIERSAEDGDSSPLGSLFSGAVPAGVQGTLPGPPAFPSDTRSMLFGNVDLSGAGRYLSYAAMVVVSNDFFLGNDDAMAVDLSSFATTGGTLSLLVGTPGQVYDAGTEVNDFNFSLANGAFGIGGGQTMPNQGTGEGGVVHVVSGNPFPAFLGQDLVPMGYDFGPLDFNSYNAVGRIDIEVAAIPEPGTYALMLAGLGCLGWAMRRRRAA
jgi:hypothetical protein